MRIVQAASDREIGAVRQLFAEYAASLAIDLAFQGFPAELAGLPGAYAPPRGRLLVGEIAGNSIGCVALRPHDERRCEMKRLYVRPDRQGRGLGRLLATRAVAEARAIGYAAMLLDTLPTMHGAIRLYESLGFKRRAPYYPSPVDGTVYMELQLDGPSE